MLVLFLFVQDILWFLHLYLPLIAWFGYFSKSSCTWIRLFLRINILIIVLIIIFHLFSCEFTFHSLFIFGLHKRLNFFLFTLLILPVDLPFDRRSIRTSYVCCIFYFISWYVRHWLFLRRRCSPFPRLPNLLLLLLLLLTILIISILGVSVVVVRCRLLFLMPKIILHIIFESLFDRINFNSSFIYKPCYFLLIPLFKELPPYFPCLCHDNHRITITLCIPFLTLLIWLRFQCIIIPTAKLLLMQCILDLIELLWQRLISWCS